jgi:NAD(P)-dependent dehydrogenase (short-subunit alcohol dehydrogenase family)
MGWSERDVDDLSGLRVLVTGGNSGIGREAVRIFADHGAQVLLACRNAEKGAAALEQIGAVRGSIELLTLDLADLGSVELAAKEAAQRLDALDVLVNNAGVMALPYRTTVDGFELQLGTNHLGHFALTARLLPLLQASDQPRVVTVASSMHRIGSIDFDDLHGIRRYQRWSAYGQSKLANLLFTFELQRRSEAAGSPLRSTAAHPGYAATHLQTAGPRMSGSRLRARVMQLSNTLLGQSAAMGALPTVYAAVGPDVDGGDYIGPGGIAEARGYPKKVTASAAARDEQTARRLWEVSEELTGLRVELGGPA